MTDLLHHCPAFPDLLAEAPSASVADHIASCPRCRALRAGHHPDPVHLAVPAAEPEPAPSIPDASPGLVVQVSAPPVDEFLLAVVLFADDDELTVIPVSGQVQFATNYDLLLENALGFVAMAEVWNEGSVFAEQVTGGLGPLPEELFDRLDDLHEASIEGDAVGDSLPVGPPVMSESDTRLAYQAQRAQEARMFFAPFELLTRAESFPQLITAAVEISGAAEGWQQALPDEGKWVESLPGGVDLCSTVPVAQVASMLRLLRIPAKPTIGVLHSYVAEHYAAATNMEKSFGRRRTKRALAAPKPTVDEARKAADLYVAALQRELSKS